MKLIIANWKMNPQTLAEAEELFASIKKDIKDIKNTEVVICPPFVYLEKLAASALIREGVGFALGGQNCFWEKSGVYTGEISPLMLKNLGAKYVLVGHSERRRHLGETDEIIAQKVKAVLENGLRPVLCVGETAEQRKNGLTEEIIKKQLEKNFKDIQDLKFTIHNSLLVVYEPVWAISDGKIGSGNPCLPTDAAEAISFIREVLGEKYERKTATQIKIIYGGSVSGDNVVDYLQQPGIDGVLPGAASLNAAEFVKLVKNAVDL